MPPVQEGINVYQYSRQIIDEACFHVNKAVVFLDDSTAEVLHWHGGATTLFSAGAIDVREFSAFEVRKQSVCCLMDALLVFEVLSYSQC